MKSQKILNKKLVLTKETITHLDQADLRKVYGGVWEKTVNATACVTNCTACPTNIFC